MVSISEHIRKRERRRARERPNTARHRERRVRWLVNRSLGSFKDREKHVARGRVCPRTTHCARDPTPARTAAVRTGGHETSEHAEAKASSGEASESEVVVSRAACGRPRAALRRMWRLCGLPRLENASAVRTTSVAMSSRIMGAGRTDLMTSMLSPVYHVHCVEVAAS